MTDVTAALTTEDIVIVGLVAETKEDATRQLAVKLANDGRVTDLDGFLADVRAREEQMATGLPGGIAVSSVLLFRLVTFWLPTVPGYLSFNWLTKKGYL